MSEPKDQKTQRPLDTALRQQRMKGFAPILHPVWATAFLLVLGLVFIPTGSYLKRISDDTLELSIIYDSYDESKVDFPCGIGSNPNSNKVCTLPSVTIPKDIEPPALIYYQLTNFYQNHRKYVESRDENQLQGEPASAQSDLSKTKCNPLQKLGNITLNPCGLVANTLFNDVIQLVNSTDEQTGETLVMREDGIAWKTDIDRFGQPEGFKYEQCSSCEECSCEGDEWSCVEPWKDPKDGTCYLYFYPDDDTTQYLYETYPMVVNPIEGVQNEHFIVWMKTSTLSKFRKLYGYIDQPISKGTNLTFQINANYDVTSFSGTKSLIVTTANEFGGKNDFLGQSFIIVGALNIVCGVFFAIKHRYSPRKLADPLYLQYKED